MADENIVTNIVAKSDFSNLISDLNKVSFSLTKLQDQLIATNKTLAAQVSVMNRSFADTLRSTGQYSTHFVSLTSDVDKFGMQLEKGQLKLGKFFQVYNQHAKTNGGLVRDLAKQQVQLQQAILQPLGKNAEGLMQYNVHIPKGLDLVKNKAAIARQELMIMNKVVQEGANQLINWGKNTQWAGRQLTVGLTVPLAAFGKASADAFRQADEQLVRLTKVYGGVAQVSSRELGKVRDDVARTAADLAKSYGAAFKDTLGLAADIAATGKQGNDLLGAIKETTRLSILGEVDRQEAMKATLAIQSAFKQNTDELSESINFLNAVENQTSTTLNDLVEAIPKAGPIIKGLGGSVQDLALYLTAMKEGGINATEGANALKSGLASLINPTNVAVARFKTFGIDLLGIVNSNAGNVTGTLLELQSALDKLNPLQKQQAIEQLFGKFQFSRLNALFENLGKQGSQTLQVLDLMKASSQELGDLASRELAQVTESASGKYRRAVEGLKADLAGIGDQFLRINTSLINFVDGIIKFVQKLPDPIKQALGFMGMLTAAAGPLIMLTGVLGNFFGYIIKGAYHFKSLFKGGEGWKLLTPEILAAQKAGNLVEQTFYSDAKAAAVLKQAIAGLTAEFTLLQQRAASAAMTVNPGISTVAGSTIIAGRVVNPKSPYLGPEGSRSAGHHISRSTMTTAQRDAQTIHSFTPIPLPLNKKVGTAPMVFAEGDLPKIEGLTASRGVSTGIVAGEAAKWHTLMGTLSMMTKREVRDLKKEIARTGTFSTEINTTFGQLLPAMTKLTSNAAAESALIVQQLQTGKITVDAARAKIIAINAQLEAMMAQTTTQVATSLGRTANLTQVPLLNQPIVGPTGKANTKEIFRANRPAAQIIDKIARALGVRTWGGGYSTETTMPKRFATGGRVFGGPRSDTTDTQFEYLPEGAFVLNRKASDSLLGFNRGGMVPAMVTPGEILIENPTRDEVDILEAYNNQFAVGGRVTPSKYNYGIPSLVAKYAAASKMFSGFRSPGTPYYRASRGVMDRTGSTTQSFSEPGAPMRFNDYRLTRGRAYKDPSNKNYGITPVISGQSLTHAYSPSFVKRLKQMGYGPDDNIPVDVLKSMGIQVPVGANYTTLKALSSTWVKTSKRFNEAIKSGLPETNQKGTGWKDNWQPANAESMQSLLIKLKSMGVMPIEAKRTAEYAANRLNGFISNHKGPMTESDWGRYVNAAEIGGINDSRRRSHGGSFIRGIRSAQQNRYNKEDSDLLAAMNMGGKVTRYNRGGVVGGRVRRGKNNYGIRDTRQSLQMRGFLPGGYPSSPLNYGPDGILMPGPAAGRGLSMSSSMGLSMAGSMGGAAVGGSMGGSTGSIIGMMAGSFLPSLIGKMKTVVTSAGGLLNLVMRIGKFLKAWSIPGAIITILGFAIKKVLDFKKAAEDAGKANRLAFGGTAESFASVGIKNYKSLEDRIKAVNEQLELNKAKAQSAYNQYTKSGPTGITLSIEELNKAIENAKKNQKEYVEAFNTIDSNRVNQYATELKAQFMGMGLSASEAANQIFAMIKASEKAGQALSAVTTTDFSNMKDQVSAISVLIKNLSAASTVAAFNPEEFSRGLDTLANTVLSYKESLVGTKDELDPSNIIDGAEALSITMKKINDMNKSAAALNSDQVNKLKEQNSVYASILGKTETISSVLAKIQMYTSGLGEYVDFSAMEAKPAIEMATNYGKVLQGVNTITETLDENNPFLPLAVLINKAKTAANGYKTAIEKSKNIDEDYYKNKIKLIDLEIKKIREAADARIKALQGQQDKESYQIEIKKLELEYQDALAAGDMSRAAQAKLNIQQLTKEKETIGAIEAIKEKADQDIKKREDEKSKLQETDDKRNKGIENAIEKGNEAALNLQKLQGFMSDLENLGIASSAKGLTAQQRQGINEKAALVLKQMKEAGGATKTASEEMESSVDRSSMGYSGSGLYSPGKALSSDQIAGGVLAKFNTSLGAKATGDFVFKTAVDKFYEAVLKFQLSPGTGSKESPIAISGNYKLTRPSGNSFGDTRVQSEELVKSNKLKANQFITYNDQLYKVGANNFLQPITPGARAMGGYVGPGRDYLVGERGPEILRLNKGGMVYPNPDTAPRQKNNILSSMFGLFPDREFARNQSWGDWLKQTGSQSLNFLGPAVGKALSSATSSGREALSLQKTLSHLSQDSNLGNNLIDPLARQGAKLGKYGRNPLYFAEQNSIYTQMAGQYGSTAYNMSLSPMAKIKTAFSKGYLTPEKLKSEFNINPKDMLFDGWTPELISKFRDAGYLGYKAGDGIVTNWVAGAMKGFGVKAMPKFHNLNGPVPGPYGQEVSAILKAGTEGVYQEPYINSLKNNQNGTMGNVFNFSSTVNAAEGQDANQIADAVLKKFITITKDMNTKTGITKVV